MITRINPYHRDMVIEHLSPSRNTPEMLLSKFEYVPEEFELQRYATGINFERDYVIGDVDDSLGRELLTAMGHMIIKGHEAELSVTHLEGCQDKAQDVVLVAMHILKSFWEAGPPKVLYVAKSNWPVVHRALRKLGINLPTKELLGDGFTSVARCYPGKRDLVAINCNDLSCVKE